MRAARAAQVGWAAKTAFQPGPIPYRVAELMEGRRVQFEAELKDAGAAEAREGRERGHRPVGLVRGVGGQDPPVIQGSSNPVAGPYFNFTVPEPTGVVGIVAPPDPIAARARLAAGPVIVSGNTAVVLASEPSPLPAVSLGEVLATSDVPGGVVNVLTGLTAELVPWLAGHMDVNAIDATGCPRSCGRRSRSSPRRT